MGLNDEKEKLKQAEEWITEADLESEHFHASCEYVRDMMLRGNVDNDRADQLRKLRNLIIVRIINKYLPRG